MKYKYGVEYPTNGKKPNLPDDTKIYICYDTGYGCIQMLAFVAEWESTEKFRIVDQRYKPISENQEKQQNISDLSENNQKADSVSGNSWYERGELPPVGVECEWLSYNTGVWHQTKVKAYDDEDQAWLEGEGIVSVEDFGVKRFRPIKSERGRLIEVIVSAGNLSEGCLADAIMAAGFRLTEDKQ